MDSALASLWGLVTFAGFVNSLQIPRADDYVTRYRNSVGEGERREAHRWTMAVRTSPVVISVVVAALVIATPIAIDTSAMDLCLLLLTVLAQAGFAATVRYLVPAVPASVPAIIVTRGVDWRQLRSQDSTRQTSVRFVNASTVSLDVNWVGWDGQPQSYGAIEPGGHRVLSTYVGHPFLLRTADGRDVAVVEPLSQPAVARIRNADLPGEPSEPPQ
ncbi:hypothetical protein [Streptomyces sp. NPDC018947]|uniref:VHL beta domain-containing protein n=1 Tax=Streptomyces sp. NPDC018947 TaxID=3365054 RepID=UPI003789D314